MPFRPVLIIAGVCLLLFNGTRQASAQTLLQTPYSIRSYGMGLSGAADDFDVGNLYYNPAVLGSLNGAALSLGLRPDLRSAGDDNRGFNGLIAGGYQFRTGRTSAVGIGGGVVYTVDDYNELRFPGEVNENVLGLQAAIRYQSETPFAIAFGIAYKTRKKDFDHRFRPPEEYEDTLFDIGILSTSTYQRGGGGTTVISFAGSYINHSDKIDIDEWWRIKPTMAIIGLGFRMTGRPVSGEGPDQTARPPQWRVSANLDFVLPASDYGNNLNTGVEVSLREMAFFRLGYQMTLEDKDTEYQLTIGLGAGYDTGRFKFRADYARVPGWKTDTSGDPFGYLGLYLAYALDPPGEV
jgi:hypothetical protein